MVVFAAGLFKPCLNHTIFDHSGVTPCAQAKSDVGFINQHAHLAGKFASPIWDHFDVFDVLVTRPFVHHKGVVHSQTIDFINALGLEIGKTVLITWQLVGGAGRG